MSFSKSPSFNLKVVLQRTGIAADTLRAWERRYGLPLPQRTPGGHRLYSEYDIETIKWLMTRQAEGLSISRAVDLWNEHLASGVDPMGGFNVPDPISNPTIPALYISPDTNLDSLRTQWLSACLAFDEMKAEQVLNQAFAIYPLESVCVEVLQRGLVDIGMQWYENRASVQQEHFTSALAVRRVNALIGASPMPTHRETILVGCPAEEEHTFTPLLVTLFLRRRGYHVIYLGADVPDERIEETVRAVRADLVVLVSHQLITAANLQQTARLLSSLDIPVAYGGRIFELQPQITEAIPGFYLGKGLQEVAEQIEDLAASRAKNPQIDSDSPEYEAAVVEFQMVSVKIEGTLQQTTSSLNLNKGAVKTATEYLTRNILAALRLGDISLVDEELDWVKKLITSNHISETTLTEFIRLYAEAVKSNLSGDCRIVLDWLNTRIER
jgi:DNA-binding transcriptional MerR regulator/methylmalonyl-CoA mutase cobalamin-binding subunit